MEFDFDSWVKIHNECAELVNRVCDLEKDKDSVISTSALCVIKHAMQDINKYFQDGHVSSAELCFLIRNVDVTISCFLQINHALLGIGFNKQGKAIEKCFPNNPKIVNDFRTLRSQILAHPVNTEFTNDKGEREIVYLEDILPFRPQIDGFILHKRCDYVKVLCNPDSKRSYHLPLNVSEEIVPVLNEIISAVILFNGKLRSKIKEDEDKLRDEELLIENEKIMDYIRSLDKELQRRYPAEIEEYKLSNGELCHNSIIFDCIRYFEVSFKPDTQQKYNVFLEYIKSELKRIEQDLQTMSYDRDNYFELRYNRNFAPALSYAKEKVYYLKDSNVKYYTKRQISNNTKSDRLWGIKCFNDLLPYIEQYIPVDTNQTDKGLYCQYEAAEYLSHFVN